MPKSTQHKRKDKGEVVTPSSVLDAIDNCLKDMLRTWPAKELSSEEIEHWHRDLGPFPIKAIEWAFDAWRRGGRFFPIYGDILDMCVAWDPPTQRYRGGICNAECKEKHDKGYGEQDILWLLGKMFMADRQPTRFPNGNPRMNRELIQARSLAGADPPKDGVKMPVFVEKKNKVVNLETLLDELDRARGFSPEWRRQRVIA